MKNKFLPYYLSLIYWNFYRLERFLTHKIGQPFMWLNIFIATKIPFMRKIAEKRRKEAGFNSIEEWCRNTSSVGEDVGTNSFNLGYFLLLILILFFSLGTVNIVLGGLLDMDYLVIYKVLTWGTDLAILYAVSIAILVFGAAMFASHSLNVKSWFPKFDKMGKTDRRRSIVITSVVSILTLIYFIISFVFFL